MSMPAEGHSGAHRVSSVLPAVEQNPWCAVDVVDVERRLQTSKLTGLTDDAVSQRLRQYGPNTIAETQQTTWLTVLARQFIDVLIWILIGAAAISATIGEVTDAVTILAIVVLNGVLGFVQEWKAERALQALRQMLSPTCRVLRNGSIVVANADQLVPGDIVQLETGDRIPADLRMLEATNLRVDESALTGESGSVSKGVIAVSAETDLARQSSMVWMGTAVTNGRGLGAVVSTGASTQFGRIASLTSDMVTDRTPLQRTLGTLGRQLGVWAVGISVLVVVAGVITGKPIVEMLMTGISLAVAVVPEGLPAVVTITLALGIRTMVRRKALLRRLQAAEALGSATVICTDKTGTLTQNQMTVQQIWLPPVGRNGGIETSGAAALCVDRPQSKGLISQDDDLRCSGELSLDPGYGQLIEVTGVGYDPAGHFEADGEVVDYRSNASLLALLESGLRCNHAQVTRADDGWHESGEPTEAALVVAALKAWLDPSATDEHLTEFSFSSDRKRMSVVDQEKGGQIAHVKGAPEVIVDRCSSIGVDNHERPINAEDRSQVQEACNQMADQGLRTLAIARRILPANAPLAEDVVEQNLTLLGIVGIIDPPRPEVPEAVRRAKSAGIKLVMITGDASRTARAIANRIGMDVDLAIEGSELSTMTDAALRDALNKNAVFARATPEHKLRIVKLLQQDGHVVGMTGDGVNDAPALKKADIGIAMGLRGTDVAKGAADIVLTDDNFSAIINAVEEGRRQYDNIQKFVRYMLSSNTGEAVAIFCNILIGGPLILLPVQILWMNLITDSLIALALGLESAETDIMQRPPREPSEPILNRRAIGMIAGLGLYVGLATLWIFQHVLTDSDSATVALAQTMAFHGIIVIEWFNVMNFRTLRVPVTKVGLFSNRWMMLAIGVTACVQMCALYLPILQTALHTVPLGWHDWGLIVLVAFPVFAVGEAVKLVQRRD